MAKPAKLFSGEEKAEKVQSVTTPLDTCDVSQSQTEVEGKSKGEVGEKNSEEGEGGDDDSEPPSPPWHYAEGGKKNLIVRSVLGIVVIATLLFSNTYLNIHIANSLDTVPLNEISVKAFLAICSIITLNLRYIDKMFKYVWGRGLRNE